MAQEAGGRIERVPVHDVALDVLRLGSGAPLLLLHGMQHIEPAAPFLARLAEWFEIIAPSHPGFGGSPRPEGLESVYDLARLHLSLLDALDLRDVTVLGLSFGGWVAAEMAVMGNARISRLILADAFGIKISDRETPDILDVFNTHPETVLRSAWHDPAHAPDLDALTDEALTIRAKNWYALCLYGWSPYMHTPQLKRWLPRIAVPTLVLWGEGDGVVKPSYGRAYSDLIPDAEFSLIPAAGHHPELEQPDAFVERIIRFCDGKKKR
jgi:pimeloyl-ACP methyl ester carboxylesterase